MDEVGQVQAAALVALGDGDHEAEVGADHHLHGPAAGAADVKGRVVATALVVDPGEDALAVAQLGLLGEDGVATDLGQIAVYF